MSIPRYIAVEGPIGVGKTTLVRLFAERFSGRMILETFEQNPFLPLFYKDKVHYAFQTEMFFLLSRYRQQQTFLQQDLFSAHTFADYLFVKSRLFASLTLTQDELALFTQVHSLLGERIARPDLVIYLRARLEVLLERIVLRGRTYEQGMDPAYLQQVTEIYDEHFHRYTDSPMLLVDASEINFNLEEEFEMLLKATGEVGPGIWTYIGGGRMRKATSLLAAG